MGIIGNQVVFNKTPGKYLAGSTVGGSNAGQSRGNKATTAAMRGFILQDAAEYALPLVSRPSGYNNAWMMPLSGGSMSSFTQAVGSTSMTGAAAAGIGIDGQADGVGESTSQAVGLAWMTGTLAGLSTTTVQAYASGLVTGSSASVGGISATISALIGIQGTSAGLSDAYGTGSVTISLQGQSQGTSAIDGAMSAVLAMNGTAGGLSTNDGILTGLFYMVGQADGLSTVEAQFNQSPGWLVGELSGSSSATLNPYAKGFMSGSTSQADVNEITPDSIAQAVWSYTV